MPWQEVEPVIDQDVRKLCIQRYPGHPRGCPNHGKKKGCPPAAPMLGEVLDLSLTVFAAWNAFDLAAHVERMRGKHPDWSRRQLVCCLYWQGAARKQLRNVLRGFRFHHAFSQFAAVTAGERQTRSGLIRCPTIMCPEACGVNVTETMRRIGIELEWPPVKIAYQVALVGMAKGNGDA